LERKNLWAPWRIEYIKSLAGENGCFICDYLKTPQQDTEHLVLWRTELSIVVFNRFPYNNGHLLIAPNRHIPDFSNARDEEMLDIMKLTRDCQTVLDKAIKPQGFNVGMNFGRCAGAGLPEHMHVHVVPRWQGDTNYMNVCSDVDVISQSLGELYEQLRQISLKENLPNV
jgi:ATP adenylyltransferase